MGQTQNDNHEKFKFTQNYPNERKDYPHHGESGRERLEYVRKHEDLQQEAEDLEHGLVTPEEATRIQSYDLPSGGTTVHAYDTEEDTDYEDESSDDQAA